MHARVVRDVRAPAGLRGRPRRGGGAAGHQPAAPRGRDVRWFASGRARRRRPRRARRGGEHPAGERRPARSGRRRSGSRSTPSDGGVVVICSDSGPGVPPELRDRLFEPEVRRADSPVRASAWPSPTDSCPRAAGASSSSTAISPARLSSPAFREGARRCRPQHRVAVPDRHRRGPRPLRRVARAGPDGRGLRRPAGGRPREGQSPGALIATVTRRRPRVVLLDLDLGSFGDGEKLIAPLARAGINVVVVTASVDRARWGEAVRFGARKVLSEVQAAQRDPRHGPPHQPGSAGHDPRGARGPAARVGQGARRELVDLQTRASRR